jgi:hypothetical protein
VAAVISDFWLLRPPANTRFAVKAPGDRYTPIICSAHEGHRSAARILGNLSVIIDPSVQKGFTWSWSTDALISRRVLDIFAKHRVTGFETAPAKVSYSSESTLPPPELFELIVTGWGGLGGAEAGVHLVESCPDCGHSAYTIAEPSKLTDPAAWDGSDLFIVWPLPNLRFASERLANIIRQEKIDGVKLMPASEIPIKRGTEASPGQLTGSMPADRARQLSERFNIA